MKLTRLLRALFDLDEDFDLEWRELVLADLEDCGFDAEGPNTIMHLPGPARIDLDACTMSTDELLLLLVGIQAGRAAVIDEALEEEGG